MTSLGSFSISNDTTRRDAENSSLFTDWLLRQGRIDVTSCKLRFQDLTAKTARPYDHAREH